MTSRSSAERPSEQHGRRQGRPARLRRHHPGARRRRRDRHRHASASEERPDKGHHSQRLRHARRQVRRRRIDRGQDDQRHRREDQRDRVDDRHGSRRPADDVQHESGRLDEMDLRAADRLQRLCRRRFRDAQGNPPHPESGSAAGKGHGAARAPIRRMAWPSPRTARRSSSAAG